MTKIINTKKVVTTTYLPQEQINRVRHLAVDLKKSISDVMSEALSDYEKKKTKKLKK